MTTPTPDELAEQARIHHATCDGNHDTAEEAFACRMAAAEARYGPRRALSLVLVDATAPAGPLDVDAILAGTVGRAPNVAPHRDADTTESDERPAIDNELRQAIEELLRITGDLSLPTLAAVAELARDIAVERLLAGRPRIIHVAWAPDAVEQARDRLAERLSDPATVLAVDRRTLEVAIDALRAVTGTEQALDVELIRDELDGWAWCDVHGELVEPGLTRDDDPHASCAPDEHRPVTMTVPQRP